MSEGCRKSDVQPEMRERVNVIPGILAPLGSPDFLQHKWNRERTHFHELCMPS